MATKPFRCMWPVYRRMPVPVPGIAKTTTVHAGCGRMASFISRGIESDHGRFEGFTEWRAVCAVHYDPADLPDWEQWVRRDHPDIPADAVFELRLDP